VVGLGRNLSVLGTRDRSKSLVLTVKRLLKKEHALLANDGSVVTDMAKKKKKSDACTKKVKSRYTKWPSAYASGALVKCRKVGAKNWGTGGKKKGKKK